MKTKITAMTRYSVIFKFKTR
uniref:Uncharacterized protein n=1 Tax=Anguilla anguilla TaxID=7936 RepID=A0A0E9Q890_ANGAN